VLITFMKYTFLTVGAYLALAYATNAGRLISAGTNAYVGGVKVLQGRG